MFRPIILIIGLLLYSFPFKFCASSEAILPKSSLWSENAVPAHATRENMAPTESSSAPFVNADRESVKVTQKSSDDRENGHVFKKDEEMDSAKAKLWKKTSPIDLPSRYETKVVDIIMFISQKCLKFLTELGNCGISAIVVFVLSLTLYLRKLRLIADKRKTIKYTALKQKVYEDVNEIKRTWIENMLKNKQKLLIDIQKELDDHFLKIMNEFQELYFKVREINSDTHQRMYYLLNELKKSAAKIQNSECECLQEMEKIQKGILVLKNEEELLHEDMIDSKNNIDLLEKTMNEENLSITRFFQEIFLCTHVQTMIEKNNDSKLRLHYHKIALANLLLNLQSLTISNQLL